MKLLLDTHLLLWALAAESERALPAKARALIASPKHELLFSPASIWEIAIKNALGRPDFRADPHLVRRTLLDNGYVELPITSAHAACVATLPELHRDPFDRMLLAQATVEGITLVTSDAVVAGYRSSPVRLV